MRATPATHHTTIGDGWMGGENRGGSCSVPHHLVGRIEQQLIGATAGEPNTHLQQLPPLSTSSAALH
ncbi:hypothetical protein Pmani_005723 [Petrolisthes manimaculis]|uniref:Uncharacterized protein n=1 Tax=Petrolisthes manimaculis TaxID=1843537 RepID=A0AAE1QD99_9EUCA|nr:hypothetical protein Pmani_005723 [Petrolisthes manimaculis]